MSGYFIGKLLNHTLNFIYNLLPANQPGLAKGNEYGIIIDVSHVTSLVSGLNVIFSLRDEMKILIADDSAASRIVLMKILAYADHEIRGNNG
jgi:hypothetical protein